MHTYVTERVCLKGLKKQLQLLRRIHGNHHDSLQRHTPVIRRTELHFTHFPEPRVHQRRRLTLIPAPLGLNGNSWRREEKRAAGGSRCSLSHSTTAFPAECSKP